MASNRISDSSSTSKPIPENKSYLTLFENTLLYRNVSTPLSLPSDPFFENGNSSMSSRNNISDSQAVDLGKADLHEVPVNTESSDANVTNEPFITRAFLNTKSQSLCLRFGSVYCKILNWMIFKMKNSKHWKCHICTSIFQSIFVNFEIILFLKKL